MRMPVVMAMVATASLLPASPAAAAPPACGLDAVCIWRATNYARADGIAPEADHTFTANDFGRCISLKFRSIVNNTSRTAYAYGTANCSELGVGSPGFATYPPGTKNRNFLDGNVARSLLISATR